VDGFGVLARLRSDPHTREVPVIVATARDLGPDELGRLEGVRQVVPKGEFAERLAVQDLRALVLSLARGAAAPGGR
jgi:CheY-like chemotaxis protein